MKYSFIPDVVLANLVKVICSILDIHSIYLIGGSKIKSTWSYYFDNHKKYSAKQTYNLTLLIISKGLIAEPKEFMNKVFTKMGEKVSIYSIHYTTKDVEHRLRFGDNFLTRVLCNQNELYSKNQLLVTGYCSHPTMYTTIKEEWEFRMNRALYFEDKVDTCDSVYDETARIHLMSHTLQQACLALLQVNWEYKPGYVDLHYLLNLCAHFCTSPHIIFPKKSFRSHKVYNALCHAQYNLNHKTKDEYSTEESDYAHQLCRMFLDQAEKEGRKRLQELERLHHKPMVNK